MSRAVEDALRRKPKKWIANLLFSAALLIAIVYSFSGSTINWVRLRTIGISLRVMAQGFTDIQTDFLLGTGEYLFKEGVVYLTLETLAIGFLGTLMGAVLALPFSFLASKNIVGPKVSKIGETILVMIRVLPEIVLAIILVKGFGINALTGVLTIGIHSIGMLGKLFAETIDNMDRSSIEALDAVGANVWQKIRYGIIPQIAPDISSVTLYRLDINVRSATVLGIIGAGGLGASMILAADCWNWDILGTILLAIIVMVLVVDAVSSSLRKKLV
jgi:phosphonate transport system permease protein